MGVVIPFQVTELPLNQEAELAVLGSMLADKEAMLRAMDILQEDDFYVGIHQEIYKAIRELQNRSITPDVITVGEHLQRNAKLMDIGGQAYLFDLVNRVPSALNVEHYAGIVREKSILRRMISNAHKISSDCYLQKDDAQRLLDEAQQLFFKLAESKSQAGMTQASTLMQSAIAALEQMAGSNKYITGIATGFRDLDRMTAGLQPANLIIVAGRPSMGKTAICLNIAEHVAIKEKKPVLFFSLEMSEQEMGLRLLCSQASINLRSVREGFLARKSWPSITNVASQIAGSPLYFDFSSSPDVLQIRSAARRWSYDLRQKGNPLALIIIDYLQLMKGTARSESRQQEISEISRSLKGLARELQVPVIALSQLNRRPEDRGREGNRPQLSDLRESGAIEQDADLVMAILREEVYKRDDPDLKGKAKICVLKQRNGPIGDVDMHFHEEFTKFSDSTHEEPF